ncbi:hypothetical protein ALC56_09433 [Trachymyrmex septentrionalis]|uniref:Secreted protein n=1 Tax=Trachymyrmex septentrionalis TaxID=34720 RepID=A0A195F8F5_9HYME|nr:hypothetical protein ALC56_09433 [Trachymyrmex septentrionalis]
MSLSRPVLIKVRTLSICFIIVELTSADSTDPRDEEVRGETRREGEGEQMSVKVMGETAVVAAALLPRREALIFCHAACNWANHLPLSDRRNVRELFTCIASLNRVEKRSQNRNVKSWCVRGSRRNADSPLPGVSDQPNDRLFADRLRKRERKEIAH